MNTTVRSIFNGFCNNYSRSHFGYTILACGHSGALALLPDQMKCCVKTDGVLCDVVFERGKGCPTHGNRNASYEFTADAHNPDHQITKVGDVVDCETCTRKMEGLAKLAALDWSTVTHTRFRPNDSRGSRDGQIDVYQRDETSPTGVRHLMSVEACPEADAILNQRRGMSPLSPSEGR